MCCCHKDVVKYRVWFKIVSLSNLPDSFWPECALRVNEGNLLHIRNHAHKYLIIKIISQTKLTSGDIVAGVQVLMWLEDCMAKLPQHLQEAHCLWGLCRVLCFPKRLVGNRDESFELLSSMCVAGNFWVVTSLGGDHPRPDQDKDVRHDGRITKAGRPVSD